MENLKSSMTAKITAMILVIVSAGLFMAGAAAMMAMDGAGVYQRRESQLMKDGFDTVCHNYSIAAMADRENNYNQDMLSQTNFRYGVIKADDLDDVDLSDASSYIAGNFTKIPSVEHKSGYQMDIPDREELYVLEFEIGENISYSYGFNIWDSFFIRNESKPWYESVEYPFDGVYYARNTQSLYVRSGRKLFYAGEGYIRTKEQDLPLEYLSNALLVKRKASAEGSVKDYAWDSDYKTVVFDSGLAIDVSDIQITDTASLSKIGAISDETMDYIDGIAIHASERQEPVLEHYYVVSYAKTPLDGVESLWKGDMFVQMSLLIGTAYDMRYVVIAVLLFSMFVFAVSSLFLIASAGHRRGQEGICAGFFDRVPLDLYFAAVGIVEVLIIGWFVHAVREMMYAVRFDTGFVSYLTISICAAIAGILAAAAFVMSLAVRIKIGKWWRNTLVCWICIKCIKTAGSILHFGVYFIKSFVRSLTILWKAWLLLGVLALAEYIVILAYSYSSRLLLFWFMEKIVLYPLLIFMLLQMDRLQKGAQRIANGELNFQVHTDNMFWEMKKHGEYLNDIRSGMNRAVNERLKSERFKTELITNVSHDIKTPLTSIINYVDLLQKALKDEQTADPAVQDYLDVLHRQSARLKKLIEDLMEASKASTGSLSVIMEQCDAGVMLIQTVGEFEEKLMENQIELQIKKPEESIVIEADSRHLWRVFDNLMNNICKYAQPMTRAYINLEHDSRQAFIIFRNISKYQLNISSEELMERFVRGDSSRNTEGSGLGISIAKSLTELMNGTFDLVIDGDLFKAVLSFPLYGAVRMQQNPDGGGVLLDFGKDFGMHMQAESRTLQGFVSGIQEAGTRAADKTGRLLRRAGRFAQHVRRAAEMAKAEEEADVVDAGRNAGKEAERNAEAEGCVDAGRNADVG